MSSGRRTSLASLAGGKVESVPGYGDALLVRLPLTAVVPTPLNPRRNFGTSESLVELGESMRRRQLQPVVVVSSLSYARLFPEHADALDTAQYIIANGERRYRAARQVGLDFIETVVREEIAGSREAFLDAVLSENIDRKNFDPIEEAHAVQAMVRECGTAAAAAARFGRTGAWVSQRVGLLRLAPDAQAMVRTGEIPIREARELAALPMEQQVVAWQERLADRERSREAAKAARKLRSAPPVEPTEAPVVVAAADRPPQVAELPDRPAERAQASPGSSVSRQRSGAPDQPQEVMRPPVPPRLDEPEVPEPGDAWVDADAMARRLAERFDVDARRRIVRLLLDGIEADELVSSGA